MSQSPAEILKRVRLIEIATRALVNDVFSGVYHSVFKGMGVEFSEVRSYQRGDDVRTIDWNVTARTGSLHVKRYQEERERTVMLALDASASMRFGSQDRSKGELAAEVLALLAFSAIANHDRVGLMIFSDKCEKFIPPKKGRKHGLRVITEVLSHRAQSRRTDINRALDYLNRTLHRRSILFVLSDFFSGDFAPTLKVAKHKHDCIAMVFNDPRELDLPPSGWLSLTDAETGKDIEVDTRLPRARAEYAAFAEARAKSRRHFFAQQKVDVIELSTDRPYTEPLRSFFRERLRKIRR
ncbi:MAG: DUF58 domain-containing protein [Candidatus Firestonebacteria bacterium]|nr:DUF58 domain-containing protein [Candidatus Firestonebacteria bacterium]